MIADLKEKVAQKAAEIDRKRLYTAVGALMIAGVAGHFMQRSADVPVASQAPAAQPVVAAGMTTAPAVPPADLAIPASEDIAAATPPAAAEGAGTDVTIAAEPIAVAPLPDQAEPDLSNATASEEPMDTPEIAALEAPAEAAPETATPGDGIEEVTRSATSPILEVPEPEGIAQAPEAAPAAIDEQPVQMAALDDGTDIADEPVAPAAEALTDACNVDFGAEVQAGALVAITLVAPCNSGENVDFDHHGLRFSEQLGPEGDTIVLVPAMAETALFTVRFEDGQERATEIKVPDFAEFERMAIVWKGATGLQLHALENGASYGEPGHVWAQEPGMPEMATQGAGGFVSVLGSTAQGYAADVYTFPAGLMGEGADPEISVEAEVMENTCDTKIEGRILRTNPIGDPNIEELSMMVPGCDAVGEYLVLKNLPQDLKLARN